MSKFYKKILVNSNFHVKFNVFLAVSLLFFVKFISNV